MAGAAIPIPAVSSVQSALASSSPVVAGPSTSAMPVISSPILSGGATPTVLLGKLPQDPSGALKAPAVAPPGAVQAANILGLGSSNKPVVVPSAPATATAPNLLQSIQQPLPPTSLASGSSQQFAAPVIPADVSLPGPSTSTGAPQFSSQMSRETADADAQISQLLENLQKEPQTLTIGRDEKMAEFIKSIAGENAANSTSSVPSTPDVLGAPSTSAAPRSLPPPASLAALVAEPPAQQVAVSRPGGSPTKAAPLPNVEKTAGTTGFQASFLNSLANRRVSAEEDPHDQQQQAQQQQQPQVSMGGGAPSQMRALQNLPPNTRLVKGPNGQFALQKIQTIELTQEQQAVNVKETIY